MNIRKYTLISLTVLVIALLLGTFSYQKYFSLKVLKEMETLDDYSRLVKTDEKEIKIYKENAWEKFDIKGVELTSFRPGYGKFKSGIPKKDVKKWLEEIGALNANLIRLPYIQPPSFYSAIYDYNLNRDEPIYIMHEIMIDEKNMLKNYDIFDRKTVKNLKKDIRKTINVMHGKSLLLTSKRNHPGLYLKDVSKYNLGFILGSNINPEIVTLTNVANEDIDQYRGKYFSSLKANAFEVFIAEMLDYTCAYEIKKYNSLSLVSFLTSPEIDPLEYKHESNVTKYARIDLSKIQDKERDNLFISYKFHPNDVDFLDYEYDISKDEIDKKNESGFLKQLNRINTFYKLPLIISDIGIPSSRGISKLDILDGYNRGGFSEEDQGLMLVKLLEEIKKSKINGVIINSWQDNWSKLTSFSVLEDYLDKNDSSYWHDSQSSDKSFGLLKFESGKEKDKTYIDGELEDWKDIEYLLDTKSLKLKAKSDSANLYILMEKKDWSLKQDKLYIGIDINPLSGSKVWGEEANFDMPVNFIIKIDGYNNSEILVNERYNIFNYLYKYYSNIVGKQDKIPKKNSENFDEINLLNRKSFPLKGTSNVISPYYYNTGKLIHGNDNPESKDFNSLADFNKKEDISEIKIPWTILNMKNSLDKTIYSDFYKDGIDGALKIKDIGFSVNFKNYQEKIVSKEVRYKIEAEKKIDYFERLKKSYYIIKDYWQENPN